MKTTKTYRLSNWALNNLEDLQIENQGLTKTEIIERALSLAKIVTEAWGRGNSLLGYGPFELDNDKQTVALMRMIWGEN